jgi:hypothetical protein
MIMSPNGKPEHNKFAAVETNISLVGHVTPCAPFSCNRRVGAHGVTRPTTLSLSCPSVVKNPAVTDRRYRLFICGLNCIIPAQETHAAEILCECSF